MPRKLRCKRLIRTLDYACANLEFIERGLIHARDAQPSLICAIEAEIHVALDAPQQEHLLNLTTFCCLGPVIAKQGKIRAAAWRDILIFGLRSILTKHGVSTSLPDQTTTEFDRPFARVLKAAWQSLPGEARGKTASALVARARTHAKHKGIPHDFLDYIASHGREIIGIKQATPMRSSEAIRYLRDQLASGQIRRGNPTAEDLARCGAAWETGTKKA